MNKDKLIGRKMRAFEFTQGTDDVNWIKAKERLIGRIGIILGYSNKAAIVSFENENHKYWYPLSMVAEHLIDEPAEEKIQAPEKGIIINVSESDGNVSYKLDSFNISAIETLGLLELISNQIKIKLKNQNPAI